MSATLRAAAVWDKAIQVRIKPWTVTDTITGNVWLSGAQPAEGHSHKQAEDFTITSKWRCHMLMLDCWPVPHSLVQWRNKSGVSPSLSLCTGSTPGQLVNSIHLIIPLLFRAHLHAWHKLSVSIRQKQRSTQGGSGEPKPLTMCEIATVHH